MIYILMYLSAIVLANLTITHFGSTAAIWVGFIFVGLDLTSRDKLHEIWHKNGLVLKMGLLIASGSLISYFINRGSGMIAIASFSAFACAALVDTLVYQLLHNQKYFIKINGSNIFSALVDSIVFPTIAFGGFLPWITLGQLFSKIIGGALWAFILGKISRK